MSVANVLFRGPAGACVFDEGKYGKGGRPCIRPHEVTSIGATNKALLYMPWRACVDYLNRKEIQNNERSDVLFRGPAGACVFAAQIRQRREVVHPSLHRETKSEPLTRRHQTPRGGRVFAEGEYGKAGSAGLARANKKRGTPLLQQVPLLCVLKPKPIT